MVNDVVNSGADVLTDMFGSSVMAPIASGITEKNKQLIYWKKCQGCQIHKKELGWVVVGTAMGPHTMNEYYTLLNHKHFTPLEKYGQWLIGKNSGQKYDLTDSAHRFDALIMAGGLLEIPYDQMKAYNWHKFPEIVKYVPELANVIEYSCEYCTDKVYTDAKHLAVHTKIWHQDVAQPKAIGQEISRAIAAVGSVNNENIAAIVAAVVAAMQSSGVVSKE